MCMTFRLPVRRLVYYVPILSIRRDSMQSKSGFTSKLLIGEVIGVFLRKFRIMDWIESSDLVRT